MKKIFIILTLLTITQVTFAGECRQFFIEMTKTASGVSKTLVKESFKSSNAITEYNARAYGPGPGVGAQQNYRVAVYNADEKLTQAYKDFQIFINDEIKKHANCFSNAEMLEILDQ